MEIILTPPVAFLIYIPLVLIIYFIGRGLEGKTKEGMLKTTLYGSGEEAPTYAAAPGYRPFFLIAFFFAVLHLGVLVLATGPVDALMLPYLLGIGLALVALLLG